jgi:5-methylcytosine-specific restriction endonuclease McrA
MLCAENINAYEAIMNKNILQHYSNEELNLNLKVLRSKEREIVSDVVLYLHEIDKRGFFRDLGYSSLFTYCVTGLGYSESGAQRRIQAARALNGNPEIYAMLRDGRLTLSTIGEIAQVITPQNKAELLSKVEGKSKTQVQSLTAQFLTPVAAKAKATVREKRVILPISTEPELFGQMSEVPAEPKVEKRYSVSLEVDAEFMEIYERAKALIGHRPMAEVLRKALNDLVEKRTPREPRVVKKAQPEPTKRTGHSTRYIPRSVRAHVYKRDNSQCTFVSTSGHRCTETVGLQYDHIIPHAQGGPNKVENLRLACRAHNQLLGERVFGDKVRIHRRCGSERSQV